MCQNAVEVTRRHSGGHITVEGWVRWTHTWAAATHTQFPRSVLGFTGTKSTSCTHMSHYAWYCSVFFFNWIHIICYKFWFCNDESPHCLLHPPFSMLQDRFKLSQRLLTSSQFVSIFWDAALKCIAVSLQIELFYMYGKVTTQLFFLFVLIFFRNTAVSENLQPARFP